MTLRDTFTARLKTSMLAKDAAQVAAIRLITARLKDIDIAARPRGVVAVPDDDIMQMLRGMVKSRRESIELYERGNRPELAAKEAAEIAVIESFLPAQIDDAGIASAVEAAIAETAAVTIKDMGKVMAALRARHGAALDMSRAGAIVRHALSG